MVPLNGGAKGREKGLSQELSRTASGVRLRTQFPDTALGRALAQVARLLADGTGTEAYLCSHGGFDTHNAQTRTRSALLGDLDAALGAFYRAQLELGIAGRVVTYTETLNSAEVCTPTVSRARTTAGAITSW